MRRPTLPAPLGALLPALALSLTLILPLALSACGGGGGGGSTTTTTTPVATTTTPAATPVVSIAASPTATTSGQVITLSWSVSNPSGTSCSASDAWTGTVATSGSQNVTAGAAGTARYTLTCGAASASATVTVSSPPPVPTVSLNLATANLTAGQSTTLSWSSANASGCVASGAWAGTRATTGSVSVTPAAGNYTYSLSCTGSGGSASASAALSVTAPAQAGNSTTINVDSGPSGVNSVINVPYVNVTVCRPGTSTCQTIDHVLLDTGSYGLRLLASSLDSTLALPTVTTPGGADAGECGKFISGYTWGAVRRADVKMADESAPGIAIQVIADGAANYATTPASCSSAGTNLGSVASLGAKGILGVGLFNQDCGAACASSAISGIYYACTAGVCSPSTMALADQVSNPVASFAVNNNGVLLTLPAVGPAGLTAVSGTLVFGVNTQSNNSIASETLYPTTSAGDFSTTYQGKTYTASFLDSGSNGYFFTDSSIQACSGGDFYCPPSTLALSAVNSAADGSASGTVNFNVVNLVQLSSAVRAAQVGGTLSGNTGANAGNAFDWGLPFFYGRRVFVVMAGRTVGGKTGPLWAY